MTRYSGCGHITVATDRRARQQSQAPSASPDSEVAGGAGSSRSSDSRYELWISTSSVRARSASGTMPFAL
jgi:hypothetical protein